MKTRYLLLLPALFAFACVSVLADTAANKEEQERKKNPIFQSSLEFLKTPVPCPDSVAAAEGEMKPYIETIPGTKVQFKLIPIKGGKFIMGSPKDETIPQKEETKKELKKYSKGDQKEKLEGILESLESEGIQHEVEVKPFWIEEHETTWEEFLQFAQKYLQESHKNRTDLTANEKSADAMAKPTPAYDPGSISHDNYGKKDYPASGLTAYAAQVYCKWLTNLTGRYYRLPTEAEWEYACRAGSKTAYSFGDDEDELENYAWFFDNSEGVSQKIKKKKPNAWGLFDMHGNLSEWVLEQYDAKTYANRKKDAFAAPVKVIKGVDFGQIARGGNCEDDDPGNLRSARRLFSIKDWKLQDPQFPQSIWWVTDAAYVGFRVVRPLEPPKTEEEAKLYEPDPQVWLGYIKLNQREN
ncbi:MAG: formylglycine-generating enzyme family protein [Planctomycetaceae bacterium]|nr:formylglycine-generating enzyme family protein [Planctomycetaceae bacterium]